MKKQKSMEELEGSPKHSIVVHLIRHAESMNNQVYDKAGEIFQSGTPDFNYKDWLKYVDNERVADPGLSDRGIIQADKLASYLVPHLKNQSSNPTRFIVSPMKRTLMTIIPTLEQMSSSLTTDSEEKKRKTEEDKCRVIIHGFYHESEGCHKKGISEPGMNQYQICSILPKTFGSISFEGFSENPEDGWYCDRSGPETWFESEARASKFYNWLCAYLDKELEDKDQDDVFDAGVNKEGEEHENEYDKLSPRLRKRRKVLLVGHGLFMTLVLQRIVAGFGHVVETENIFHRSAFVHCNTGITDLEYFGSGRFLVMSTNQVPHLSHPNDCHLKSGGGLKDGGWRFLIPTLPYLEAFNFIHEDMDNYVKQQVEALKSLYIQPFDSKQDDEIRISLIINEEPKTENEITAEIPHVTTIRKSIIVKSPVSKSDDDEKGSQNNCDLDNNGGSKKVTIVVKRGLQVIGFACFDEAKKMLIEMVIHPSEARDDQVGKTLVHAIRNHINSIENKNTIDEDEITVQSACKRSQEFFRQL